jgi:hypothetical protein
MNTADVIYYIFLRILNLVQERPEDGTDVPLYTVMLISP